MPHVYIMFRQSNSRGSGPDADIISAYRGPTATIQAWNNVTFAAFDITVNDTYPVNAGFSGAQCAFLHKEQQRLGETIYFVMYSVGGTPLYDDGTNNCWISTRAAGLHTTLKSTLNGALVYMWNTLNIRTNYHFIFVPQGGENDTLADANANAYQTNSEAEIQSFLLNFGTAFDSSPKRWMIPRLSVNQTFYDATRLATVQGKVDALCAADSANRCAYNTDSQTVNVDGQHYIHVGGYQPEGEGMSVQCAILGW